MSDQNHECGESCEEHQHADTKLVNALLDEVLSMVDELGDRLACMGKALKEAECAGAAKNKTNRSNHG